MLLHLKELMRQKGVSSIELASVLGVSKTMVSYWINGKNFPSPEKLEAIAETLKVPVWQLFASPTENVPKQPTATLACPHCGGAIALHPSIPDTEKPGNP